MGAWVRGHEPGYLCLPMCRAQAPDTRAGGGAPALESRLSTLATSGFGVRISLEATTG